MQTPAERKSGFEQLAMAAKHGHDAERAEVTDAARLAIDCDRPRRTAADRDQIAGRAFARQDWPRVVSELEPVLEMHERVGGSRAQRDLLEYAVTYALLRDGAGERARRLISKRRPQNGKSGFPLAGL